MKHFTNIIAFHKVFKLLILFMMVSNCLLASNLNSFTTCLNNGDVIYTEKYFSETTQVTILNQSNYFNPPKAVEVLNNFLAKNKLIKIEINKKGYNKTKSQQYGIGYLKTENKIYKVFITLNKLDLITELQIK